MDKLLVRLAGHGRGIDLRKARKQACRGAVIDEIGGRTAAVVTLERRARDGTAARGRRSTIGRSVLPGGIPRHDPAATSHQNENQGRRFGRKAHGLALGLSSQSSRRWASPLCHGASQIFHITIVRRPTLAMSHEGVREAPYFIAFGLGGRRPSRAFSGSCFSTQSSSAASRRRSRFCQA